MNIKELLTNAGFEIPENVDLSGLETKLAKMYTPEGKQIPYERFQEKVKELNETNAKLAEIETELTTTKEKLANTDTLTSELEKYKTKVRLIEEQETEKLRNANKEIITKLKVPEDNKNYTKYTELLKKFNIKEKDEDYTKEELSQNMNQFDLLKTAGIFDAQDPNPPKNTPPAGGDPSGIKAKSTSEMMKGL